MDGIDWITVVEVVPVTAALALFGLFGALSPDAAVAAAAICGAVVGFAPFNKPVARLFLGDVGSLPLGLILGWLLIRFGANYLSSAFLLSLYYAADATITLFGRFARGEAVMQPHRLHFYQRAVDRGLPLNGVLVRIAALNCVLAGLAAVCVAKPLVWVHIAALIAGCACTAFVLVQFASAKR